MIKEIVLSEGSGTQAPEGAKVEVGGPIPENVEPQAFPKLVIDKVPQVRPYHFFVKDRQVVIIDPQRREVLEVID